MQTDGTYSVKVQFNPLELTTEEGTKKIYAKIKSAARRVCYMASDQWDAARTLHYRQCYDAALAKGVDDVNSKNLSALHQQGADGAMIARVQNRKRG
jgi:UrcA family protein